MASPLPVVSVLTLLLLTATAQCPGSSADTRFSDLSLSDGSTINIPAGQTYFYDLTSSPRLGGIHVSGTLIFEDTKDLSLDTIHLTARSGGIIQAGGPGCPFQHLLTITLHHDSETANPDEVGTKVIGVESGGSLQLVGNVQGPTWVDLGATAMAGDTTLTLLEPVQWAVGDEIVIACTDFGTKHIEELNIAAISSDGLTLTLTTALEYNHYSGVYKTISMRAEVGLLTRNIKVQGDESSATNSFGGHIMVLVADWVYIQGVEVTRAGQKGHLGRYPIHFHLAADMEGKAFIYDNSIHHNYQRSLTIHGTDSVQVWRNVVYKTNGHAIFLEDAVEQNNYFAWNLVMAPRSLKSSEYLKDGEVVLEFDKDAACYWITNPQNTFVHNRAVGGDFGFWLAFSVWPTGKFASSRDYVVRWMQLGLFAHNAAHSANGDGMMFDRGMLTVNGFTGKTGLDSTTVNGEGTGQNYNPHDLWHFDDIPNAKRVTAYVYSFTSWKNKNRGAWSRPVRLVFHHFKSSDNFIGMTSATSGGPSGCVGCVFVGENPENPGAVSGVRSFPRSNHASVIRGYEYYDGPNHVTFSSFYDFQTDSERESGAFGVLLDDRFGLSPSNYAQYNTFGEGVNRILFNTKKNDGDKEIHVHDHDGSTTGYPPPQDDPDRHAVMIQDIPYFKVDGCIDDPATRAYICPNIYGRFRMEFTGAITFGDTVEYDALEEAQEGIIRLTRSDKVNDPFWLCGGTGGQECSNLKAESGARGLIPFGYETLFDFKFSAPTYLRFDVKDVIKDDWVIIGFCYPPEATVTFIDYGLSSKDVRTEATSWAEMANAPYDREGDGLWYHDKESGYIFIKAYGYHTNLAYSSSFRIYTTGGEGSRGNCSPPSRSGYKRALHEGGEAQEVFASFTNPRNMPAAGSPAPFPDPPEEAPTVPREGSGTTSPSPSPSPVPTPTPSPSSPPSNSPTPDSPKPAPAEEEVEEFTPPAGVIGCFVDDPDAPDLSAYSFTDAAMTRSLCLTACEVYSSTSYGLQNGDTCYCADESIGLYGNLPMEECITPCVGDETEYCGGVQLNMVYEIVPDDGIEAVEPSQSPAPSPSPTPTPTPTPTSTSALPTTPTPTTATLHPSPTPSDSTGSASDAVGDGDSWTGFGTVGLVGSILIIVAIVVVVVVIIAVAVVLYKKNQEPSWKKTSKDAEMY